jgi:hypothetical protein
MLCNSSHLCDLRVVVLLYMHLLMFNFTLWTYSYREESCFDLMHVEVTEGLFVLGVLWVEQQKRSTNYFLHNPFNVVEDP